MPEETAKEPLDWKDKTFAWLFQQGVSTVLLFVLIGWAWQRVPQLLESLNQDHRETVKAITESQERQNTANLKAYRDECEAQRRHDDEKTRIIRDFATGRRASDSPE